MSAMWSKWPWPCGRSELSEDSSSGFFGANPRSVYSVSLRLFRAASWASAIGTVPHC